MTETKAYKCDYCKHLTISKSGMYKHESKCFNNPVMKACKTCINCHMKGGLCEKPFTYYCKDWRE
jgi:hypothetical protein